MAEPSQASETPYVARPTDVAKLREHFDAANAGNGRTVLVTAPVGGGKRAMVGELIRSLPADDVLVWRASLIDEEPGLQALLRLYATLYAALHRDPVLKGRVEMILNSQMPKHTKRVQQWYQAFIDGLRKGGPKEGEQNFQVSLPRDNPVIGLVEIVAGIARKLTIVAEIQNVHATQSIAVHALLESMMDQAPGLRLLQILSTEPLDDTSSSWQPSPWIDMQSRRKDDLNTIELAAWGEEETSQYLASKGLSASAAELVRLTDGRPGYIAELVDLLVESDRLGGDLSTVTLANLYPRDVDEDELEEPAANGENKRRHAGAADIEEVAFRAALLGRAFPSGLLADVGGFDRDSVDDLLDATGDLFEELQFSKPLNTWIYQFKRASFREGALQHGRATREDAAQLTRQTALFLERFLVPRDYAFLVKTARLYAEAGEPNRAAMMRSMAISADRPELWAMNHDLMKYFKDRDWPEPMRRTVYMNLMDRMVGSGDVNQAEALFNEIMTWANERDDKPLKAWLLFAGSRLDFRRQDHYRARDRAKDALALYTELNDPIKPAEIRNHMAMIELSDGNTAAAKEAVNEALRSGQITTAEGPRVLPQVAANAEYIRGLVEQRDRKFTEAAEHFRLANEIAGNTGQAPLALESGLKYGESLLAANDATRAADVLQKVLGIAQSLGDAGRQRSATALLAQSHASIKQYEAALKWAKATLELTEQLKFDRFKAVDTFNVGLFSMLLDRPTEALALFRQARAAANLQSDVVFAKELLYNQAVAAAKIGEGKEALESFSAMLPYAKQAKDNGKVFAALFNLGSAFAGNDPVTAKKYLREAVDVAEKANMKEERRRARKKLEELGE